MAQFPINTAIQLYIKILQLDGIWRIKNQKVYCDLRDYIATHEGKSQQEVQEHYEEKAVKAKYNIN